MKENTEEKVVCEVCSTEAAESTMELVHDESIDDHYHMCSECLQKSLSEGTARKAG